tara:strand:+ start:271 stop:528 length:258 start_codon:yes stop_codon:yes gene_type:complete
MKKFLKRVGKTAVNIKTAPIRAKAKLLEKGARVVGAQGVADMAEKIAQPLSKGGMPIRNKYKYGGEVTMEGSQPKYKGMPKCMPN